MIATNAMAAAAMPTASSGRRRLGLTVTVVSTTNTASARYAPRENVSTSATASSAVHANASRRCRGSSAKRTSATARAAGGSRNIATSFELV